MRFVRQRQHDDCGVACVAMLAGVSYATALAAFHFKTQKRDTTAHQIINAMHELGFFSVEPTGKGSWFVYQRLVSLAHQPTANSIIKEVTGSRRFHWLVYNARTGNVWDPNDKKQPPFTWRLGVTMTHYIPFTRRAK